MAIGAKLQNTESQTKEPKLNLAGNREALKDLVLGQGHNKFCKLLWAKAGKQGT